MSANAAVAGAARRALTSIEPTEAAVMAEADPLQPVGPGDKALREVETFIRRHLVMPDDDACTAIVLWVAHTHGADHFESTPRLALLSPEPASGKTRALEIVRTLVPRPMLVLSASTAALFRSIETHTPTLLVDECDTIFTRRGKDDTAEELRALLNAGHRKGETIPRCTGPTHDVHRFPVFAPVALAGLGDLPDTLMSRSIVIRMHRRAPHEHVEPFRIRIHEPIGHGLREQLAAWMGEVGPQVGAAWPDLPAGVTDRAADVWEPLIAIADAAGGPWPSRARNAAVAVTCVASETVSLGVQLLTDVRTAFGDRPVMSSADLVTALRAEEEAPWDELHGKGLTQRGLARRLAAYGVHPVRVRVGDPVLRGYRREDLWDVWQRYLPLPRPQVGATSATSAPAEAFVQVSGPPHVADPALR
jgi:hypothetical protein